MAASTASSSLSRDFTEKDSKIELTVRPSTLDDDKLCNDFTNGIDIGRRPYELDLEASTMASQDDSRYDEEDGSPMDVAEKRLSSLMSSPLLASSLQAAMDSSAFPAFFNDLDRKRADSEGPDFFSEAPPSKRSKPIPERRRGRPRKEEISENEDLRTVAKRMYARAYRENMKSKFLEVEQQLNDLRKEYALMKASHKKLESLVEQCTFCSSSWALVKNMNIDPVVLRMAYDTLSNIKSPGSNHSSSKTSEAGSRSASVEC